MKKQTTLFILFNTVISSVIGQSWTNFNQGNSGLFSNNTWDITNDIYNNIWISLGTGSVQGNGLDKFDGINWTHYDTLNSGLPHNPVRPVKGDANGNIWIHYFGGAGPIPGLTKFDGVNWTVYDTSNAALIADPAMDIQMDKQNNIWFSCWGGLVKYDGITFTNYNQCPGGMLALQDSANIWLGGYGLRHFNPITGVCTQYDQSNSNIPSLNVGGIALDTNGLLWISFFWNFNGGIGNGGSNGGLATFDGTTFTAIWPFQNVYTGAGDIIVDANNDVWVATNAEGVYKFDGLTWTQVSGLPAGNYGNLLADQQNNIWVSSIYSGVWTNSQTVGISQQAIIKEESLFPNPARNIIIVSLLNSSNVKVLNSVGEIVIEKNFPSYSTGRTELDVSSLSSGIYFIKAGDEVRKFVKE